MGKVGLFVALFCVSYFNLLCCGVNTLGDCRQGSGGSDGVPHPI